MEWTTPPRVCMNTTQQDSAAPMLLLSESLRGFWSCLHISFGILPGLFDSIQGRLSQKSSLMISRCSITILALARFFFSFSAWVLDCSIGPARSSISSTVL